MKEHAVTNGSDLITKRDYSRGIKLPKLLAPANTQRRASHLILSKTTCAGAILKRKTPAFLSLQTSRETNKVMDVIALRWGIPPPAMKFHQPCMSKFVHCVALRVMSPNHSLTRPQRQMVKRQWTKRCSVDSVHCLQRGAKATIRPTSFC
jgi:hypothetical protein